MSVRQLIIGGITVPVWGMTGVTQSYTPLQAVDRRRTAAGSLVQRSLWTGKLRTVISGDGPAPSGLQEIDTSASYTIACVTPLAINSASNVIDIPSNRRVDSGSTPIGFAEVNGSLQPTPVSMNVDQATLTIVSGATAYQVRWFPILTVLSDPIRQDLQRSSGFGWSLTAEEV